MKKRIAECVGFQWDEWNSEKNWVRHGVSNSECEEVFFNRPIVISDDEKHSNSENRYYALGRTDRNTLLFFCFTIRDRLIRVISARGMNEREIRKYNEKNKRDSKL